MENVFSKRIKRPYHRIRYSEWKNNLRTKRIINRVCGIRAGWIVCQTLRQSIIKLTISGFRRRHGPVGVYECIHDVYETPSKCDWIDGRKPLTIYFGRQFLDKTVDFRYDARSIQRTNHRVKYSNRKLISHDYTITSGSSGIKLLIRQRLCMVIDIKSRRRHNIFLC